MKATLHPSAPRSHRASPSSGSLYASKANPARSVAVSTSKTCCGGGGGGSGGGGCVGLRRVVEMLLYVAHIPEADAGGAVVAGVAVAGAAVRRANSAHIPPPVGEAELALLLGGQRHRVVGHAGGAGRAALPRAILALLLRRLLRLRPRRGPRLGRSTLELGRLRVALHAAALPPLGRLLALGRGAKTAGRLLGEQLRRRNFRRRGGKDRPDRRAEAVIRGAGRRHAPLGRIGRIRHPAQRVDARVDLHAVGERQPRLPQPQPVAGREEVVGEVEQVQRGGDEVVVAPHRPHRRHVQPALGGRRLARPPG
mmetsp:Transcript_27185/g.89468  ORF Transcript_27185/g.89468 Transcript_27185/m.89468 type:complete len:310 (-) Transcript_27185:38-967(-)